jgi:membrane protease YdiL (CAAX protease family)
MNVVRLCGIALSIALYASLPKRPLFAAEVDSGWTSIAAFAVFGIVTWCSLAAIRRVSASHFQDGIAAFFLVRATTAQNAGITNSLLIIAAPLAEEILFRGSLSSLIHPAVSIAVFAVIHEGLPLKLMAAAFGVFMEVCSFETGALELGIAIHAAVNWTAFVYFRVRVHLVETADEVRMLL